MTDDEKRLRQNAYAKKSYYKHRKKVLAKKRIKYHVDKVMELMDNWEEQTKS